MFKKLIRILVVAVLVAAIVFGVYFIKKYNTPVQPVLKIVPINAAYFFKTSDLSKLHKTLNSNTEYWQTLTSIEKIDVLNKNLNLVDSVLSGDIRIKEFLDEGTIIVSAHLVGNTMQYLHLVNLRNSLEAENAEKYLNDYLSNKGTIDTRKYNSEKIYSFKRSEIQLHYAFVKGVFVLSHNQLLVEEAIRQADAEHSILDEQGFHQVRETEGKYTDVNLYVNLNKAPQVLSAYFSSDYSNTISDFTSLGNWIELDINLKEEGILLNGFTSIDQFNPNYFNIFIKQEPVKFQAVKILPKDIPLFVRFGISDFAQFRYDIKKYEKEAAVANYTNELNSIKSIYHIDIEQTFARFFDSEFLIAYSTKLNKNNNNTPFCIVGTKARSVAENELLELLKIHARNKNKSLGSYYSDYKIDKDITNRIYEFPVSNICGLLFGRFMSEVKADYFTFVDNYLLFAESKEVLIDVLKENIIGNTLSFNMNFNTLTDNLSSKSNFLLYSNIPRSNKIIQNILSDKTNNDFEKNREIINKFYSIGFQFLSNGEMIYNNIYLQYNPVKQKKATTLWESKIDDQFNFKPEVVKNHYTNDKEIFLQDQTNAIYLVSNSGRILWKHRLNEAINSEVYQIDYYKNGKYQLMFSTKNYLHLIDRNGNYVDKYPVKLKSPSTAGMSLFDYAKNLDYRVFIPCSDSKVYLYEKSGKINTGWKFGKTESVVKHPVQHFLADGKDYIVFNDSLQVYILNRRGETRVKLSEPVAISKNNTLYLEKKGNFRMVSTNTNGEVVYIYFSGTVDRKQVIDLTTEHYFDYKDVDGDYKKDLIFIDKNKLTVLSDDIKELFNYTFPEIINTSPIYFLFPGYEGKIGITSTLTNEIYLFNDDGSLYNGFPLIGNTSFSISRLNAADSYLYLLVGDESGFLLNYQLK